MKKLLPLFIILTLAAALAGGVYLFSQTVAAQSFASHGHESTASRPAGLGEQLSERGPFGGLEPGGGHGHSASPLGALPELIGHLAIMFLFITATLAIQKLVRRFPKFHST